MRHASVTIAFLTLPVGGPWTRTARTSRSAERCVRRDLCWSVSQALALRCMLGAMKMKRSSHGSSTRDATPSRCANEILKQLLYKLLAPGHNTPAHESNKTREPMMNPTFQYKTATILDTFDGNASKSACYNLR